MDGAPKCQYLWAGSIKLYCTGLLLPGERKSVEPMAARLAPENVRRMHQSLHHVVADAAWSDEALLGCTRDYALAAMTKTGPVTAWIVDDAGLPKKGTWSLWRNNTGSSNAIMKN
jgi:SRSO17 transposase